MNVPIVVVRIAVASLSVVLIGCYGMGDYRAAQRGEVAVDPAKYAVDPSTYPTFRTRRVVTPPPTLALPDKEIFLAKEKAQRDEAYRRGWRPARQLPPLDESDAAWRERDGQFYADRLVAFQPVDILPNDIWRVSYKVGDVLLIHSDTFQQRECNRIASSARERDLSVVGVRMVDGRDCQYDYSYNIFVTPEGHVAGGWKLLRIFGPEFERRASMSAEDQANTSWSDEPLFQMAQP